jgi:peptide/nickel transport system ATP-binding protein
MNGWVEVEGLQVCGPNGPIVDQVSFEVARGEVLALIGESGSGKTTIALTLMGYVRGGCRIAAGAVRVGGRDVAASSERELQALRGAKIAYIAQSAAAAFNPSLSLMDQVVEPALAHGLMGRGEAEAKALKLFRSLGLPSPETIGRRYPHQVSGGQLQRLMAAMALITDPELVILDEPTTALDVTTQIEALRVFKRVVRELGVSAVYVSHDLAVVAQMADRIVVLNNGRIKEQGTAEQVLEAPADPYTRSLVAAAQARQSPPARRAKAAEPILELRGLSARYGRGPEILHDVDLVLERGGALGVIGESGSGKSTLARVVSGLLPASSGEVLLAGQRLEPAVQRRTPEQLRRIQIVFQNADTALNPAHTVGRLLARPVLLYEGLRGAALETRVRELLELIRLPASYATRRCAELSGGQKQRINLARALAARPDVVLCDEVTSALDTVVAAAMLAFLADLRRELGLSMIFISHDISAVQEVCDEVAVFYAGEIVERAPAADLAMGARHPYTELLIASTPQLRKGWLEAAPERAPVKINR